MSITASYLALAAVMLLIAHALWIDGDDGKLLSLLFFFVGFLTLWYGLDRAILLGRPLLLELR